MSKYMNDFIKIASMYDIINQVKATENSETISICFHFDGGVAITNSQQEIIRDFESIKDFVRYYYGK